MALSIERTTKIDSFSGTHYYGGVSKKCSEAGCDSPVVARGLCAKHYQRLRRGMDKQPGQVGRPRTYPEEVGAKYQGAPILSVRLEPELRDWVKEQGGATWMRQAARNLRLLSEDPDFERWWEYFVVSSEE